jgi:hypothetical protein
MSRTSEKRMIEAGWREWTAGGSLVSSMLAPGIPRQPRHDLWPHKPYKKPEKRAESSGNKRAGESLP